jgi:RNA polymerase sigma-54 factor
MRCVVEHTAREQRAFVLHGPAALLPLTRAQVATAIGVHESTVSRAVAGRSALLPCGRVVELKAFFCASLCAHEALRELVAREQRPLSDDELAAALSAGGHPVARRTVAKYRSVLGIPPSARR